MKGRRIMNILAAVGSAKKNGNTSRLLSEYLQGVRDKSPDVKIDTIYLQEEKIAYCIGCEACQQWVESRCIIEDKMNSSLYQKVEQASVLVLATPIYVFNMSGQMKTFLDRLYAVDYRRLSGKKVVLLTTYGDQTELSAGVQHVTGGITMMADMLGIDYCQNLNVSTFKMPVSENVKSLSQAYLMGTELQL